MDELQEIELENEFLNLLLEIDPNIGNRTSFAQEFAKRLAGFADVWATHPEITDSYEQSLNDWIEVGDNSSESEMDFESSDGDDNSDDGDFDSSNGYYEVESAENDGY